MSNDRVRELEAEVARLQTMLATASDFILLLDASGTLRYINHIAPGFRFEDVVGTPAANYVPAEFRTLANNAREKAIETRQTQSYQTLGLGANGALKHYLTRLSPLVEDGEVRSLVMLATDVTELEEALRDLQHSRAILQLALDASGLGIWVQELLTGRLTLDARTRSIFGDRADTASVESLVCDATHPDDRARVQRAVSDATSQGLLNPLEYRILRPGGSVRWVVLSATGERDAEGRLQRLVGSVMDITDRRALESRLFEAEKLESLGRLAGGVAHDFNNLLTTILGNLALLLLDQPPPEQRVLLDETRLAAERSAALTAQLLTFARRRMIEPRVVDPSALIGRLEGLLKRMLGSEIDLSSSLVGRGRTRVDPSQLEQVLLNLVTNAKDALPRGGHVRIETADVVLDEAADPLEPGRYVVISVVDDGAGIEPSVLPHVFDPFFSTRLTGTGLGLATCYGIVKQAGGHIAATSEPGHGARFRVYLPQVDDAPDVERPPGLAAAPPPGARILVVEDDGLVQTTVERILRRAGHEVHCARDAQTAIADFARFGPFELLVTDVVMPGGGGRALARTLLERCPQLGVLFMSGYAESSIVHQGVVEPGLVFLQKPFHPDELLARVHQLLDRRR